MWETLHNNAGWDCFRALILPEILKTRNREKVYSNLGQQLKRKPEGKKEDLDVNTLIWECL